MVRLEPDVAEHFPNEVAVNDALRMVIGLRRIMNPPTAPTADADEKPQKQSA